MSDDNDRPLILTIRAWTEAAMVLCFLIGATVLSGFIGWFSVWFIEKIAVWAAEVI